MDSFMMRTSSYRRPNQCRLPATLNKARWAVSCCDQYPRRSERPRRYQNGLSKKPSNVTVGIMSPEVK